MHLAQFICKTDPFEAEVIEAFAAGTKAYRIAVWHGVSPQTVLNFLAAKPRMSSDLLYMAVAERA